MNKELIKNLDDIDLTGCIGILENRKGLISRCINFFQSLLYNVYRGKRMKNREYPRIPHVIVFCNNKEIYESGKTGVGKHSIKLYSKSKLLVYRPILVTKEQMQDAITECNYEHGGKRYAYLQLVVGYIYSMLARSLFRKVRKVPFPKGLVCSEAVADYIGKLPNENYQDIYNYLVADDINRVSPLDIYFSMIDNEKLFNFVGILEPTLHLTKDNG